MSDSDLCAHGVDGLHPCIACDLAFAIDRQDDDVIILGYADDMVFSERQRQPDYTINFDVMPQASGRDDEVMVVAFRVPYTG